MKYLYARISVISCILFFLTRTVSAQTWQSTASIFGDGTTQIQDIATDAADNSYSVGIFTKKITTPVAIGTTSNVSDKTFIIRKDASGAVTFSQIINAGSVKGYKIAVDAAGNMYIAGSMYGSTVAFGGFSAANSLGGPNTTAPDGFIAKYSNTGTFLWAKAIGSTSRNDEILDMALDSNGDIYVTGYISADAPVYGKNAGGPQATTATILSQGGAPGLLDVMVAKFNSSGVYQFRCC